MDLTTDVRDDITELLAAWRGGDREAAERLVDSVYPEIKRIAQRAAAMEEDLSLQATELVHEAFIRLSSGPQPEWLGRKHFYVLAARVIRRVLIDHARRKAARKRDPSRRQLEILERPVIERHRDPRVAELQAPLEELAVLDPTAARVIDLRFFVGLSVNETAAVLEIGRATVSRKWRSARAWLHGRLRDAG